MIDKTLLITRIELVMKIHYINYSRYNKTCRHKLRANDN